MAITPFLFPPLFRRSRSLGRFYSPLAHSDLFMSVAPLPPSREGKEGGGGGR